MSILLRLIYRVLAPPPNHPTRYRYPLRLLAELINGAAGHSLRYGCLPPPNLLPYWVNPRGFHCLHYRGYSHSPPAPRFAVILVIRRSVWWWNPSRTLIISPITTQISIPYNITDCATAFYIASRACTVAPVFSSNLTTIPATSKIYAGLSILPTNCCYYM